MARPITWESVTAPNFNGSLAASQAAGDTISNALKGLAGAGQGYMDETRKLATDNAVAGILNSADPLAAAAAAPQGWQVDAATLQKAALGQDQVNRANESQGLQNEASRIASKTNQAQLDDILSTRASSTIASNLITQMPANGDISQFDLNDPRFKGPEGEKALATFLAESHARQKFALDKLDIEGRNKDRAKNLANQKALNWEAEKAHDPDFLLQDPQLQERQRLAAWKGFGADLQLMSAGRQLSQGERGTTGATAQERAQVIPGMSINYNDAGKVLKDELLEAQRQQASAANSFQAEIGGRDLQKKNVFSELPKEAIPDAVAKQTGVDVDEAQSRLSKIQAAFPTLDGDQVADIALATRGRWNALKIWDPSDNPEAVAMAERYKAYNDIGRDSGLAREQGVKTAPWDAKINSITKQQTKLETKAAINGVLDEDTATFVRDARNAADKKAGEERARENERLERERVAAKKVADELAEQQRIQSVKRTSIR